MKEVTTGQRVGGFEVRKDGVNTLFAVTKAGSIYSRTTKCNTHFNRPNAKWAKVAAVPPDAEWIGQYPTPTQIWKAS